MSGREPAWRVLAVELLASVIEERGAGDRSPSYLLSPLGARMNRVLMVGTLASPETPAAGGDPGFLRTRLTDPTGAVTVTAGSFQPRALAALQAAIGGTPYVVVGKTHLFRSRTDQLYASVRAEGLAPVAPEEMRTRLLDAAEQTLARVELCEWLRAPNGRSPPAVARRRVDWARAALERYPSMQPEAFRQALRQLLGELRNGAPVAPVAGPLPPPPAERVRIIHTSPAPVATTEGVSAAARAEESMFLDLVDELSERSVDGYADLRETIGLAGRRGVPATVAERLLDRLEEEGVLEEPIVGKLRRA